jgi:cytochrome c oxidase subunit II
MPRRALRRAAPAAAVLVLVALALDGRPRADPPRVIDIVARRFQFTPDQLTLRRDEPVILRLRSEDVTHGFFLKPLGIDTVIVPGKITELHVTPHVAGRYTLICDHFCGSGHGNMKMTVLVE